MTANRKALRDSLSSEIKHGVAAIAAASQSHRAKRIMVGLPARSAEVSDDDTMMETDSDDTAPTPSPPMHSGYIMTQMQAHYNAAMA
ncbi:NHL repeat-containing protein 2 [Hordeum vulgare]|nr:NHL repeat-containing protein 2 [Hordeum vulgare]